MTRAPICKNRNTGAGLHPKIRLRANYSPAYIDPMRLMNTPWWS